MQENNNKIICVTGASGYIATFIVRDLLEKGYKVNGTVRDPTDEKKNEHLTSLKNASTHLKLFKAELNVENAFDEAVKGAFAVIHVASPFFMTAVDPEKEIVQTAITGTKNILSSCSKYGIKTVLYTSSGTAMFFKNAPKDHIFSEEDWSDEELMRKNNLWYQLSKTLAEKAFWEWSNSNKDVRCVAVIPSLVSGPPLQSSPNTSNKLFFQFVDGSKKTIANYPTSIVDVRDVATGHILALEKEVTGRYFITAEGTNFLKICDTFRKLFPERSDKIPTSVELKEGEELKPPIKVNNQKAISLGLKFIDIEQSLKETIEVAIKSGFLI